MTSNSRFSWLVLTLLGIGWGNPFFAQITFGGQPLWTSNLPSAEQLPHFDREQLEREDAVTDLYKEAPWRFGVEHDVAWSSETHGSWTSENGQLVWRLLIDGADATCMSLRFQHFEVPKGGQLFLYAADHSEVLGALDHRSEKEWGGLATGVVQTNALVVEYHQPLGLVASPLLDIDQVVQGYRHLSGWPHGPNGHDRGPFGNSGACNINVNCPEGAAWATESRSVALIVSGGFASCTGGLVNNTANDGTPYFLTANHCLGNPGNWVYYFNHESATCNGNNGPTNQSISGGTLLVNSGGSDVALIELSQTPPPSFNVQYAGWDASGVTPTSTVGIHHPSGDLKKICFDDDSPSVQSAGGAAVWYVADWDLGVTEPGSSGSPLFDQNHRVIGQLYGGTAACQGSVDNDEPDWYGRFDVSWDAGLSDYLDAGGTGTLVWDGYPDGAITYDNDAGVNITGYPEDVLCNVSQVSIDITLTNTGNNTLTSCIILFSVNGGAEQQQSWAGNLAPGDSELVSLGSIWSQGGTNTVEAQVTDPNGTEDENVANNTSEVTFDALEGPTYDYNLTLVLDAYPDETTWELTKLGQTLYTGGPYTEDQAGETIMESFCLPEGCYIFRIEDEYDDGICCDYGDGSWTLTDPGGLVVDNGGDFGDSESTVFCADAYLIGCTDEEACNFSFNANIDDGSCVFPGQPCDDGNELTENDSLGIQCFCVGDPVSMGCTDPLALNYDPTALVDDGSCFYFETGCGDLGAAEWAAYPLGLYAPLDTLNHMVAEAVTQDIVLHLPSLLAEPSTGSLYPILAWDSLTLSGLPPGLEMTVLPSSMLPNTQQCLTYSGQPNQPGQYEVQVSGMMTLALFGQPFDAGLITGTITITIVPNPNPVPGCTYAHAVNFVVFANVDDGSCQFAGCTDLTAPNYEPFASLDDGSCEQGPCEDGCPGDLDEDGSVGTPDLLALLSSFGLFCDE